MRAIAFALLLLVPVPAAAQSTLATGTVRKAEMGFRWVGWEGAPPAMEAWAGYQPTLVVTLTNGQTYRSCYTGDANLAACTGPAGDPHGSACALVEYQNTRSYSNEVIPAGNLVQHKTGHVSAPHQGQVTQKQNALLAMVSMAALKGLPIELRVLGPHPPFVEAGCFDSVQVCFTGSCGPVCGDSVCEASEDCGTCPEDCAASTFSYMDADGDGWGNSATALPGCTSPAGYVALGGDCNDTNATIRPFAGDVRGDGIDSDCDGLDCAAESLSFGYVVACNTTQSWANAGATCKAAGYDGLASIRSFDEQKAIQTMLEKAGFWANTWPWIGLKGDGTKWTWTDGNTSSYTYWGGGEPNGSGADCVHMNVPKGTGFWNDAPCGDVHEFLCMKR